MRLTSCQRVGFDKGEMILVVASCVVPKHTANILLATVCLYTVVEALAIGLRIEYNTGELCQIIKDVTDFPLEFYLRVLSISDCRSQGRH